MLHPDDAAYPAKAAYRAWCALNGNTSQAAWDDAPDRRRDGPGGVQFIHDNPSAGDGTPLPTQRTPMDTQQIAKLPVGTEVYLRVRLTGANRYEDGWYSGAQLGRPGVSPRQYHHLDIECVAPPRPLKAGDKVTREGFCVPRTILFIHRDKALADVTGGNLEIVPLAALSRI